ncbi:phosphatase 2C-like domain-containing protein [Boeremia exigua]|uniref:phosphatase 2C-like domain-containing protein n=1 Tax=Boeremia exigua TaxID=749465 RepID=UPI001E8EC984|nr:phosphatase 2C-like domain-containing protein [Boeremia exigua]KAH6638249.1 phosphatase 2C-like domain-containing protein [Boeremia exigua]
MPALLRLRSPVLHLPRTVRIPVRAPRSRTQIWVPVAQQTQIRGYAHQPQNPHLGTTTPVPDDAPPPPPKSPFYFEAGYALYAKRPSRPFPPPFLSLPSTSFSEPLSTYNRSRDRRPRVNGEMIRGVTNGDDAVLVSDYFIGANDGVGAWATRERGHAALWSRLILHFWSLEVEAAPFSPTDPPTPIAYLQTAFDKTKAAVSEPNEWHGTTTACGALLSANKNDQPLLYVTQIGDGQILVIRPSTKEVLFRTEEQWHWFDCPRQLGTNSPDTPDSNAALDQIEILEDDVVIAMTDGVVDNLWEHEVVTNVCESIEKWRSEGVKEVEGREVGETGKDEQEQSYADGMRFVAQRLVNAAREIAEDPFAESPYMEKAIDEGLSIEGGKLDDISVVAAQCKRRNG